MLKKYICVITLMSFCFSNMVFAEDMQDSFIEAVATGLSARAEVSDGYNAEIEAGLSVDEKKELWLSFISPEMTAVEPYRDITFEDPAFDYMAHMYMNGVSSQEMALECLPSYEALFNVVWNAGYYQRATALLELREKYGLEIGDVAYNEFQNAVTSLNNPEITVEISDDNSMNELETETGTETLISGDPQNTETGEDVPGIILFKGFNWGATLSEVKDGINPEAHTQIIAGENKKKFPVESVLYDNGGGPDFLFGNINVIFISHTEETVAGYPTDDVDYYFARPVNDDGTLNFEDEESVLYGGAYEFVTVNAKEMSADLLSKLTALYGEPDEVRESTGWTGATLTYYHWTGANDTELGMKVKDMSTSTDTDDSEIRIGYAWSMGDSLLTEANSAMEQLKLAEEAALYGNDDNTGL